MQMRGIPGQRRCAPARFDLDDILIDRRGVLGDWANGFVQAKVVRRGNATHAIEITLCSCGCEVSR
jgi:hypothetical protein